MTITCTICGFQHHSLISHVAQEHGLSAQDYVEQYSQPVVSDELHKKLSRKLSRTAVDLENIQVNFGGVDFTIDTGVDGNTVLPMPRAYNFPKRGKAAVAFKRALRAVKNGRNAFIWGMPGTGKDAFGHAFSALTRKVSIMVSFKPGEDLSAWFYKQVLDSEGSRWEYGAVWKAVTEGVLGRDGKRRAPLILMTDVDRADQSQAEWFRMMTDSISGRIQGPHGNMVSLFVDEWGNSPQFVCTANSCGSGDARGRMTSANPIDGSIMDRLGAKIQAHYMVWTEESAVLKSIYQELATYCNDDWWATLGSITKCIRKAIEEGDLYAEFTMRGLVDICNDATDILKDDNTVDPIEMLKEALMAWTDGLDEDGQFELTRLVDPMLNTL